jgi:hypothetical protein
VTPASLSLALPVKLLAAVSAKPPESLSVPVHQLVARTLVFFCRDSTDPIDSAFRFAGPVNVISNSNPYFCLGSQKASLREQLACETSRKGCNGPALTPRLV